MFLFFNKGNILFNKISFDGESNSTWSFKRTFTSSVDGARVRAPRAPDHFAPSANHPAEQQNGPSRNANVLQNFGGRDGAGGAASTRNGPSRNETYLTCQDRNT